MIKDKRFEGGMLGNIKYHDYLFLIVEMDAEWSRRSMYSRPKDVYDLRNMLNFCAAAREYGTGINVNYRKWREANNEKEGKELLARWLYNPVCYVPMSHADDACWVLLDDYEPIHHLTTRISRKIEDVCTGYCLNLDGLQLTGDTTMFCDLHELPQWEFGPQQELEALQERQRHQRRTDWPKHDFQNNTPFMVFTKFKMDCLLSLGQAAASQQALFTVMATRIQELVRALREQHGDGSVSSLMSLDDIKSARCCLLDIQRTEEIGLLVFCANFSVAMTLVTGLRKLQYRDLFATDPRLKDLLSRESLHQKVLKRALGRRDIDPPVDMNELGSSHVFQWSNSRLFVSPATLSREPRNVNGLLEAWCEFQILPGHAKNALATISTRVKPSASASPKLEKFHRFMIGAGDFFVPLQEEIDYKGPDEDTKKECITLRPIATRDLLRLLRENVFQLVRATRSFREKRFRARSLADYLLTLSVPVPFLYKKEEGSGERKDMMRVGLERDHLEPVASLVALMDKGGLSAKVPFTVSTLLAEDDSGSSPMNLETLFRRLRDAGLPVSFRNSIESLYLNFFCALRDPFVCDMVLDLVDVFETFHCLLTTHLPEKQRKDDKAIRFLDEDRIHQISRLVEAIDDALTHRLEKEHSDITSRDMSIHYRGGLNQALLASSALMTCGLGLLRHHTIPSEKREEEFNKVGVVTRLTSEPGARCMALNLGITGFPKLGYFEVDVPHILQVVSYTDYIHEACHFVYQILKETNHSKRLPLCCIHEPQLDNHVSEVFATLFTQLLVFGTDRETAIIHWLCVYSRSIASFGENDADTIVRFTDLLIRLYLVYSCFSSAEQSAENWLRKEWQAKKGKALRTDFVSMVHAYGPFFAEYDDLWTSSEDTPAWRYTLAQFKHLYSKMAPFMRDVKAWVGEVYEDYSATKNVIAEGDNSPVSEKEILDAMEKGLNEGRLFLRHRIDFGENRRKAVDSYLDSLCMISKLLYKFIFYGVEKSKGKLIHLQRDPKRNQEVIFPKAIGKTWHEFQINRASLVMFSPVPTARRKRLRRQIVVLKTLWDVSSTLRARRFERLIDIFAPDL